MLDLAIVGGGPAGLATAYNLRNSDLDVVVFEAGNDIGGRTLSVHVGGFASNTGAMFVYRGTPAEEFANELGVRTAPFTPTTFGIHTGGATVVDTNNERVFDQIPLSSDARAQLKEFVEASLAEYALYTEGGQLKADSSEIVDERVSDRLVGLDADVAEIIRRGVQGGSTAAPEDLSAQYALRYFASYLAHETNNRLYALDGMQAIPRALAGALADKVLRLNTRISSVRAAQRDESDDEYFILETAEGERVEAREVVLTVPAPIALSITDGLPQWKRDALEVVKTPGSTTLSVTADVSGLDDVADWAFLITANRPFDVLINPQPGSPRFDDEGRQIAQFVGYGNSAGYRPDLVEGEAGVQAWVEEFLMVAPQLRGRILGAHLQTWEYCFAVLTPERLAALPELQRSVGGLHFAGDHTSATAGTHGAYTEARRVADGVRARRA